MYRDGFGIPLGFGGPRTAGRSPWRGGGVTYARVYPACPERSRGERSRTSRRDKAMNRPRADRARRCGVGIPVGSAGCGVGIPVGFPGCSSPHRPASAPSAVKSCNAAQHEKTSRKPFTMRSYARTRLQLLWNVHLQIIRLKVPWNEQLQKIPGGGASALVANTRLKPHFSQRSPNQLQIIGLKLKSRGTNTYKKCRAEGSYFPLFHSPLATVRLSLTVPSESRGTCHPPLSTTVNFRLSTASDHLIGRGRGKQTMSRADHPPRRAGWLRIAPRLPASPGPL